MAQPGGSRQRKPIKVTMADDPVETPQSNSKPWVIVLFLVAAFAGVAAAIALKDDDEDKPPPAEDTTLAIGDPVRFLRLQDDEWEPWDVPLEKGPKAIVIWFWSSKCPCVKDSEPRVKELLTRYEKRGVALLAIDSDPNDAPDSIKALQKELKSEYDVYRDRKGQTARMLGIKRSASVAILDEEHRLRYRGPMNDHPAAPTRSYAFAALDAILAGAQVNPTEVEGYGMFYPQR